MIIDVQRLYPKLFRGICGLPTVWGEPIKACLPELERCIKARRARRAGYLHSAGLRGTERHTYSMHFINEESVAVLALTRSKVFKDFPTLKIVVSHGVGTIRDPKTGRWLDDIAPFIEGFEWLSAADKTAIFSGNAKKVFKLDL